jgi:hypothetical protein
MKYDKKNYTSLNYDDCGGVNLKCKDFNIKEDRWRGNNISEFVLDSMQYKYLEGISQICKTNDIQLIFVQNPYRKNYFTQLDEASLKILNNHEKIINSILTKHEQIFISTKSTLWEDDLFLDYSHFNAEGAKIYTNYFLNEHDLQKFIDK